MGASVRPIPATLRDALARAVMPQSTRVGAERNVALSAPFANLPISRMGPQVPGAIPLPQGTLPNQTQDVGGIARAVAGAVGQGTGITSAFQAGQSLSSGRGFDRIGGKQPIAGPLVTAALAAAPIATGEAGPMLRAVGGEASAGAKALAPEFTSALGDAIWRARIDDLNFRGLSPVAEAALPSELRGLEIPMTAPRRSVAQAVMDSVATMPLKGTKVVDEAGNPRVVYHGTSQVFPSYDMSRMEPTGMYGPGIYHTESPVVAGGTGAGDRTGYAFAKFTRPDYEAKVARLRSYLDNDLSKTARQRAEAELADAEYLLNNRASEAPNVRPARLAIKNPLDIDRQYSAQEADDIFNRTKAEDGFVLEPHQTVSGGEIYNQLLREFGDKSSVNESLQSAGYDGITHIGGANTGTAPHRVWIAFDPSQVRSAFDPIESARQVGAFLPPIALGAGAATRPGASPRPIPR